MLCSPVFLEYWAMGKVQKPSNSGCYTPLSEPCQIYLYLQLIYIWLICVRHLMIIFYGKNIQWVTRNNKKFWEELITYFSLIWPGHHRKWRVQQYFYSWVCICCHNNISIELLARTNRRIPIQTHRLMEGIYEVCHWDGLKHYNTHTKFHTDWFRHSKVDGRGLTDIQTAWWSHKPTFIFSKWGK
jgi:hypothetical protein